MTPTRLTLLGLSVLALAATGGLTAAPPATAQPPLPTYTCKYTSITDVLGAFNSMKGRRCTASPGAPLDDTYFYPVRMENSTTGEKWECGGAFVYFDNPVYPGMLYAEEVLNGGVNASNCRPI